MLISCQSHNTVWLYFLIRFLTKIDHYFPIFSSDGIVYYLIFKWWRGHRPIFVELIFYKKMTTSVSWKINISYIKFKIKTQRYFTTTIYSQLVICEVWYFTIKWKTSVWPHHFKGEVWSNKTNLSLFKCMCQARKLSGHVTVCLGICFTFSGV
jgi:hypothetical protein